MDKTVHEHGLVLGVQVPVLPEPVGGQDDALHLGGRLEDEQVVVGLDQDVAGVPGGAIVQQAFFVIKINDSLIVAIFVMFRNMLENYNDIVIRIT